MSDDGDLPILTVGHSDHAPDVFVAMLATAGVRQVVDVRRYPSSRRHPQFTREGMKRWLPERSLAYRFAGDDLGGMRQPDPDSPNEALFADPSQAYADHLRTEGSRRMAGRVRLGSRDRLTALMCAEAKPDACHRRLLSDLFVLVHGITVLHLAPDGSTTPHRPHPAARVDEHGLLVYDVGVNRPLFA